MTQYQKPFHRASVLQKHSLLVAQNKGTQVAFLQRGWIEWKTFVVYSNSIVHDFAHRGDCCGYKLVYFWVEFHHHFKFLHIAQSASIIDEYNYDKLFNLCTNRYLHNFDSIVFHTATSLQGRGASKGLERPLWHKILQNKTWNSKKVYEQWYARRR